MFEVIDETVLELLPNLRIVANYGVGYDGIDVAACARRGVAVTNTPGVVDGATADMTMALLLACRRRTITADRLVRRGSWRSVKQDQLVSDDVHNATLGIVGCGRVGQAVARRARGFDMRLLYTQRKRLPTQIERALDIEHRRLHELLPEVDVLTIHCPLTAETEGLIGSVELGRLRDGATVINTARGRVLDQDAMVAELVSGRLVAGLDVFADEPSVPDSLYELSNVVLSPHLATATTQTRHAMTRLVVENILAAADGRPLLTPVPTPAV
jgi:glyoxylate reductase